MKKLLAMLALAAGVFTFTGCDEDDDTPPLVVEPGTAYDINGTTALMDHPDYDASTNTLSFYKKNDYTLEGLVYIPSGMTLDIEEGTVIKTKEVPGDGTTALIITRGAKIMAEGTMEEPIIFTSVDDDIADLTDLSGSDNQLWGGLVILGNAPVFTKGNNVAFIEGIEPNPNTEYGGSNPTDNSGVLRYVSIRHTGAELAPGDEIQGLTLGGVGSGTEIDYVESFASSDDGVEIFGGTVAIKHFAVAFSEDDCFDLDLGWRGSGQYLFAMKGGSTGNAMAEWDGASPDDADLYTNATIANATLIGSGDMANSVDNTLGIVMRDGFGGKLFNSIITGVNGYGIEVEDIPAADDESGRDSYSKLVNGELELKGNIFWVGNRSSFTFDPSNPGASVINVTGDADNPNGDAVVTELMDFNSIGNPGISITALNNFENRINPIPTNTALVQSGNLHTVPNLENPGYAGAFDPASSTTWLAGWTAISTLGYVQQ